MGVRTAEGSSWERNRGGIVEGGSSARPSTGSVEGPKPKTSDKVGASGFAIPWPHLTRHPAVVDQFVVKDLAIHLNPVAQLVTFRPSAGLTNPEISRVYWNATSGFQVGVDLGRYGLAVERVAFSTERGLWVTFSDGHVLHSPASHCTVSWMPV